MSRASLPILLLFVVTTPIFGQRNDDIRYRCGNIEVRRLVDRLGFQKESKQLAYFTIYRDYVDFGHCFEDAQYRRLPTTYYHPLGPLGLVFQKYNWFPGPVNTYHADARLPASLTALGFSPGGLPMAQLLDLWSEPPVAVIGMNTGTVASYARPFQHFHFYEPTKEVIELNDGKERYFQFLPDARNRGTQLRIIHGPPRKQLREHGPAKFYQLMILEACSGENGEKIFLDLFTTEGISQCFTHLVDEGILCVHTSHRFVDLPRVLGAIGRDLKLHVRRGHDQAPRSHDRTLAEAGHFSSEWVLLSRNKQVLEFVCKAPDTYEKLLKESGPFLPFEPYWSNPAPLEKAWTDKGPNLLHGILRGHPFSMRYSSVARPVTNFLNDKLPAIRLGSFDSHQFVATNLGYLPLSVQEWMVQWQLKRAPEVEKLWP
ncbi:MAG TPA: hypothetical protein VKE98_23605 [Gemmataceae bacterium]|nr:hypothetical protein [Gemmataceae bacterium]